MKERKEMFDLTTHSAHLRLCGVEHIVNDKRTTEIARVETRCHHYMG